MRRTCRCSRRARTWLQRNDEAHVRRYEATAITIDHVTGDRMDTHIQTANVTVGGDFNVVTAQNIQNSSNKAADARVPGPLKAALKDLSAEVAELAKALPRNQA